MKTPTKYEYKILHAISENPGLAAHELHEHIDDVMQISALMRALNAGEKKGTIKRSKTPDRRKHCKGRSLKTCYLTRAGQRLVDLGETRLNNLQLGRIRHDHELKIEDHRALDAFIYRPNLPVF